MFNTSLKQPMQKIQPLPGATSFTMCLPHMNNQTSLTDSELCNNFQAIEESLQFLNRKKNFFHVIVVFTPYSLVLSPTGLLLTTQMAKIVVIYGFNGHGYIH